MIKIFFLFKHHNASVTGKYPQLPDALLRSRRLGSCGLWLKGLAWTWLTDLYALTFSQQGGVLSGGAVLTLMVITARWVARLLF